MGNTNKAKTEQLGMPAGTAANRLRKQLLFKYVQIAGDDLCYVCEDRIETVEDFTIEHMEPWFNRDPDLFWNLDNIAFSHAKCNIPHTYPRKRNESPEGESWCSNCGQHKPIVHFDKLASRWNGCHPWCKACKHSADKRKR